jgi:hypothetical protein
MRPKRGETEIARIRPQSPWRQDVGNQDLIAQEYSWERRTMHFCIGVRFAASRFYRFFEYELSIFIACRAFPQGRKMAGNPMAATIVSAESGSVK